MRADVPRRVERLDFSAGSPDGDARPPLTRRQIAAVAFGNGFEFYDFTVYATFALPIGRTFFPATDPLSSLLASSAAFAVGFGARPLGALAFGAYADRRGRKPALLLTIALMALGTLGVALAPGHAVLGAGGAVLVVLARLVQGFALGGEIGPSVTYLSEAAGPRQRARAVSWLLAASGGAVLAAGLVGSGLSLAASPAALDAWGWRVALLLGLGAVPAGLAIRAGLPPAPAPAPRGGALLADVLRRPVAVAAGVAAILGGTVAFYVGVALPAYAVAALGFPPATAFAAAIVSGAAAFLFPVLGGALADRFGWRPVVVWSRLALALAAVPAFLLVEGARSLPALLAAAGLVSALNGLPASATLCAVAEAMPARARATGLALVFALGASLFGGTTPFVVTALIAWSGDPLWPGYYLAAASLAAAAGAFGLPARPARHAAARRAPIV